MISYSDVQNFASRLPDLKVLVVGDLMLDRYLWGKVNRISPEAPVPVVDVIASEGRPGGAANVALNVASLGAEVMLCGVVGKDAEGEMLRNLLQGEGFDTSLVMAIEGRKTTTKTRIIGNRQQMMRVDSEQRDVLSDTLMDQMRDAIRTQATGVDVLIFEDYDKGVLSPTLIQDLIAWAKELGIPTVVDPKFRNFFAYAGCSLFKPNLKELSEGMQVKLANDDFEAFGRVLGDFRTRMPHENTLVTLSEMGVLAFDGDMNPIHIPAHYRKITDVSGAGDTVVALMGLALAGGLSLGAAAYIANLGGGLVCEEVGVVPVSRERLFEELDRLIAPSA